MDLSFLAIQALNGLASASSLFITACGLTLVFGVTRIVNFTHGSLYMIGAYTAATLVPRLLELSFGPVAFWAGRRLKAVPEPGCTEATLPLILRSGYASISIRTDWPGRMSVICVSL